MHIQYSTVNGRESGTKRARGQIFHERPTFLRAMSTPRLLADRSTPATQSNGVISLPCKPPPPPTSALLHFLWLPASSTRIIVCHHIPDLPFTVPPSSCTSAGYTIVFKNEVSEESVMKYMDDIVDAGGRLTQSYDSFLNVCATSSRSLMLMSTGDIAGLLRCHPRALSQTTEQKYRHRLYWYVLLSVIL